MIKEKNNETINVMIVEDEILHQELFKLYIDNNEKYNLVCTTDNAALADIYLIKNEIDLILMDVCTAMGKSGLDASERIKKAYPNIKIIIITSFADHTFINRAKNIGVDSFWYKEMGAEELIEIMDLTMAGNNIYPSHTLNVKCGNTYNNSLTETELNIIKYIVDGMSYKEIADKLELSYNTVRKYVNIIFEKTGYNNKTDLAVIAIKNKLVYDNKEETAK